MHAKVQSATVNKLPIRNAEIGSSSLFDAVPHYPVQIINPSLVLIIGRDDGEILGAGRMAQMRRVLREQMSAAEMKRYIYSWPRFMSLHFECGLEPRQTNPSDNTLILNASGLLKMCVIFKGRPQDFLERGTMGYGNAGRFVQHVAKPMQNHVTPMGLVARLTHNQLQGDPALQFALKGN